jgi:methionyl-tRNA synthetase
MADYLGMMELLGINPWVFGIILVWSAVWKLLALWKSARKGSPIWFVILAVINTMGILEILYIFVFSECCNKKAPRKQKAKKQRR